MHHYKHSRPTPCGNIQNLTSPSSPSDAMHAGVFDAKRALRARILSARDQMPAAAHAEAGRAIATALVARADFQAARALLLTLPFGSEWDAAPIFAIAIGLNKLVVLPRVNLATRMLELCAVTDLERDVAPGYRGIREPLPRCTHIDPAAIDWVLVPGVAFDRNGKRLGYGGGFYDRLLPLLPPAALRVAGGFELQIVDNIPYAAHDLTVDAVVTEARTLSAER
jgi:5-formyltetrahydrofolate cyclo-ligase